MEGPLFFLHLYGRDEPNVRVQTIFYIITFATAAGFFLAVMRFVKPYFFFSLQGTSLIQIGLVLYHFSPVILLNTIQEDGKKD